RDRDHAHRPAWRAYHAGGRAPHPVDTAAHDVGCLVAGGPAAGAVAHDQADPPAPAPSALVGAPVSQVMIALLGVLAAALGAVAALVQEIRIRTMREARDAAIAGQAAAEAHAERAEAALAAMRAEMEACHDALSRSTDPAVVRDRLRDLLSGLSGQG